MVAEDFRSFGRTIVRKMIVKIASYQPAPHILLR
jgi:hypothetical protein